MTAENEGTTILHYEYMHIRMKKQSTKGLKVAATSNSIPKYVIVSIDSNNMLNIYDTTEKLQIYGKNTLNLLRFNLTQEGVCNDASEIISMATAKTPGSSYRKDN